MNTIIKTLVKSGLLRARDFGGFNDGEYKLRVHGLGMLQIYIPDDARIHIWDGKLRVDNVSQLHSHAWGFRSTVVAGVMRQKRYKVQEGISGHVNAIPHKYNLATITPGAKPEPRDIREVWLRAGETEVYNAGSYYWQESNEIHASGPEDGTVTLVERIRGKGADEAKVLWPVGTEFVTAAPRVPTYEEAEAVISHALKVGFQ